MALKQLDLFGEVVHTAESVQSPTINNEVKADADTPIDAQPLEKKKRTRVKKEKRVYQPLELLHIPPDEILAEKLYYSIGEVAKWFNLNTIAIRKWEVDFSFLLNPRKNRKGDRMYTPADINHIKIIYHLLKIKKFSVAGANEFLKSNKETAEKNAQLGVALLSLKQYLIELKASLK